MEHGQPTDQQIVKDWCERHGIDYRRLQKWRIENGMVVLWLPVAGSSRAPRR